MKINDISMPVVILNCKIGALAIMRSLGALGVPIYGVDEDPHAPALMSRYCKGKFIKGFAEDAQEDYLEYVLNVGKQIGRKSILIPTSDETSIFAADYAEKLSRYFIFPQNDPALVRNLASKKEMFFLAKKNNVPAPLTEFPQSLEDVLKYIDKVRLPVMLKGIFGNRLQAKTGRKMLIVHTKEELIENYKIMEDQESPNLMLQEYIPGGDDQVYIFNGYFNKESACLAAFTGHKIRQSPIHEGCASLGVCTWNETVADITIKFMKAVGYSGILDIGYRLDPRDGQYKVLDINPRVGQAFRLFLSENGMDVVRSLYLDLTGQEPLPIKPREGRRWVIEDFDIISSYHYYKEGSLSFGEWLRSFKKLEEGAWFSLKDPVPFLSLLLSLSARMFKWLGKKAGIVKDDALEIKKAGMDGAQIQKGR